MADGELRAERLHIMVSPFELQEIDDWRFANRASGRSEAIRSLIKKGLEAYRKGAEGRTEGGATA